MSHNPRSLKTLSLGVVSDIKVDLFLCRKEQGVQNSADWVSDRILGEPKAEEVRATGQCNHPEVLTGGDT